MKNVKQMTLQQAERLLSIINKNPHNHTEKEMIEDIAVNFEEVYKMGIIQGKIEGMKKIQSSMERDFKSELDLVDMHDRFWSDERNNEYNKG